jgi:hypothetical protein
VRVLTWTGGLVEDFELRLLFLWKAAGGGVNYRNNSSSTAGYRCQVGPGFGWLVDRGRPSTVTLAMPGERVVAKQINGTNQTILSGQTAPTNQIQSALKPGDWNELAIIATNNHFVHQINGVTVIDVRDERPSALRAGTLALQIAQRQSEPVALQFKDIRLKRFPMKSDRIVFADDFEAIAADGKLALWNWMGEHQGQQKEIKAEGQNHFVHFQSDSETNRVQLAKGFPVDPSWKRLKFSIKVRTQLINGASAGKFGAEMSLEWHDPQRKIGKTEYTSLIPNASSWTSCEKSLPVPASAVHVIVSPTLHHARGSADFDDLTISVVP